MALNFTVPDISGNALGPSLNLTDPSKGYAGYSDPVTTPSPSSTSAGIDAAALYASMGLSSLSSILTTIGQARALTAQGEYEQSISETNAALARLQGKQTIEAGDVAASRKELETEGAIGAQRAAGGASGVDVNTGSSAIVGAATRGAGAIDELTIRNNAARQAWGYQTEAIQDTFKGQIASLTSKAQTDQTILTGGLQAVSGPLAIESNYLRWSRYMGGGGTGSDRLPFNMSTN